MLFENIAHCAMNKYLAQKVELNAEKILLVENPMEYLILIQHKKVSLTLRRMIRKLFL